MKKISQREARRLRARVAQLERDELLRVNRYRTDYPGGVHLATISGLPSFVDGKLACAHTLGAALVVRFDESAKRLLVYAVLPT